jgi:hypothetical protein
MRGGQSATRRTFRLSGSMSTAGSRSRSPTRGAGNRSCNASPRLAAQGRRFPSPWASTLPVAHERPTRAGCSWRRSASLGFPDRRMTALSGLSGSGWTRGPGLGTSPWECTPGYDLQLTQYDERGWRATFYTTGMEHSPTSATGTAWERTPWHATQRAAWEALVMGIGA